MEQCTFGLSSTINFGPGTLWLSFAFFAFWLGWLMLFVGGARERFRMERDLQKRMANLVALRHVAPAPAQVPIRVDPRSGIIAPRWSTEEEVA